MGRRRAGRAARQELQLIALLLCLVPTIALGQAIEWPANAVRMTLGDDLQAAHDAGFPDAPIAGGGATTSAGAVTSPTVATDDFVVGLAQCSGANAFEVSAATGDVTLCPGALLTVTPPASGPVQWTLREATGLPGGNFYAQRIGAAGLALNVECEFDTDGTIKDQGNCPTATMAQWSGTFPEVAYAAGDRSSPVTLSELENLGGAWTLSGTPLERLTTTRAGMYRILAQLGTSWQSDVAGNFRACFRFAKNGVEVGSKTGQESADQSPGTFYVNHGVIGGIVTLAVDDYLEVVYLSGPNCGGGGTPPDMWLHPDWSFIMIEQVN